VSPKNPPPARPSATRRSFHRVGGALYLYAAVPVLALFFLLLAVKS
jgi:hypothetical protein